MKKEFIKPNFTNSNMNISATLAEFLNVPNKNATLPLLKEELAKGYKNVVFICFDGLGINPIDINLDDSSILKRNIKQVLTSTFPSTTTNATASLLMNKVPLEHGWLGWSLYFDDLKRNIDIFLDKDSATGEDLKIDKHPFCDIDYYFDHADSEYTVNTIFPNYVKVNNEERNNVFESENEFFDFIKDICNRNGKQFIYAYYPDPDHTMHECGVTSSEAYEVINSLSTNVSKLVKETTDTLFIITADHGQIDITGYVEIIKDEKIMDMLEIYPYLDSRSPCFKVKTGKEKEFEKRFKSKYGKDFVLRKSKDLIDEGYFGDVGDKGFLLGDYIGIGTYTHKQMILTPKSHYFKGHHTSLTEEMLVPLIIINN